MSRRYLRSRVNAAKTHKRPRTFVAATLIVLLSLVRGGDGSGSGAAVSGASESPPLCRYAAGARASETLGIDSDARARIPITHVIVLMQENRSFDHYFGRLPAFGHTAADGFPAHISNPDSDGNPVFPYHLPTTCLPRDPPHQWLSTRSQWNQGKMNGFVTSADDDDGDGRWAMGYYDASDLPFYYWLARTYSLGDRHFAPVMGGTWPNRQFFYTATAQSLRGSTAMLIGARSIFDALDEGRVPWRVYTDGPPRQDCIGWKPRARGVQKVPDFLVALREGTLPAVSFLDPNEEDEHPPADVQRGERWARTLYDNLIRSPLWPHLVLFLTYDEGGGFFDHVPPPAACAPDAQRPEYDRRGGRVPMVAISPWARPNHVSHVVNDHTSLLRFIELLHDLPALSARDANADALLDLFDFSTPRLLLPPPAPAAGRNGCRPSPVAHR